LSGLGEALARQGLSGDALAAVQAQLDEAAVGSRNGLFEIEGEPGTRAFFAWSTPTAQAELEAALRKRGHNLVREPIVLEDQPQAGLFERLAVRSVMQGVAEQTREKGPGRPQSADERYLELLRGTAAHLYAVDYQQALAKAIDPRTAEAYGRNANMWTALLVA
jgi:hypothetical protein